MLRHGYALPEIPDELSEHVPYIEHALVGAEDATITHRIHPEHGAQLVVLVPSALDLIDIGRSLESAQDQLITFDVEQDVQGQFVLIVDTALLDQVMEG